MEPGEHNLLSWKPGPTYEGKCKLCDTYFQEIQTIYYADLLNVVVKTKRPNKSKKVKEVALANNLKVYIHTMSPMVKAKVISVKVTHVQARLHRYTVSPVKV